MTTAPARPGTRLRVHQQEALAALDSAWAAGRTRAWVALPPGAGKTLVGLMTVRDRIAAGAVGRAVVLGPNTAIQGQWAASAAGLGVDVGTDRSLQHQLTALTYQALAVFDADDEVDDDGVAAAEVRGAPATSLEASAAEPTSEADGGFEARKLAPQPPSVLERLHENGRAFIEELKIGRAHV